jgi:SHS2 domain-containing protein
MKKYRLIDHTADIALQLIASSYQELFEVSIEGYNDIVFDKLVRKSALEYTIRLTADNYNNLLVEFLNEVNYYAFVKKIMFKEVISIDIFKKLKLVNINAKLLGYIYDPLKSTLREEIKAITYHNMEIIKKGNVYKTEIIFDI